MVEEMTIVIDGNIMIAAKSPNLAVIRKRNLEAQRGNEKSVEAHLKKMEKLEQDSMNQALKLDNDNKYLKELADRRKEEKDKQKEEKNKEKMKKT